MNTTDQHDKTNDGIEAKKELIRLSLTEIVHEVEIRMREAGLNFPVFVTVPSSGEAYAAIATPISPPDSDWLKVSALLCQIVGEKLGGLTLHSKELPCAIANSAIMGAADLIAD